MSQPYVGEIRMFGGNFAPAGWMFCEGQLLPISENDILFNLIGTTYGGDGQSTFALPDLRGRVPIHQGTNPSIGITHTIADIGGTEAVTLTVSQIPSHSHPMLASADPASVKGASGKVLARAPADAYASEFTPDLLNAQSITVVGGSQPHENMQPYLCVSFIISLFGVFPTQT
jgi:microcystin-dependent protein